MEIYYGLTLDGRNKVGWIMGFTIKIVCEECDYNQALWLGTGFNYDSKLIFFGDRPMLSMFIKDEEEQRLIAQLMDKPNVQIKGSERRAYRCIKCSKIYDKYYYCIKFDGGEYMPNYYCSDCTHQLEAMQVSVEKQIALFEIDERNVKISCPKCRSLKVMSRLERMDWD